jgi:hypothetical protein
MQIKIVEARGLVNVATAAEHIAIGYRVTGNIPVPVVNPWCGTDDVTGTMIIVKKTYRYRYFPYYITGIEIIC